MPVVLGLQGLAVHATHGCVVGRRDLRPFPRVPPSDDVSVFHFGGPRAAVRTRSSSTTLNLDGFHIHSRVRAFSLHSPRSLTRGAPMHRSFGSARRARGASRCAAMRSARTRCGATTRREVTTGNIVTPDNPSLVDRVLQTFATPASSLNEGIATFYDESSGLWEDMWGEHMHHGYYEVGKPVKNHQEAQVDMIENALQWAGVTGVEKMVDVGCGIGGSSRHIARKFGCAATGITLSPKQAARANAITQQAGLAPEVSFQVADALNQPFDDDSFDFVWSMESGEHMPDKDRFIAELTRVCKPGGRILIVTWCHRVLEAGETALKPDEEALLKDICSAYYLPAWCSIADYARIAESNGLTDIKTGDWSDEVQPFWGAVIQTALTPQGFMGLLKAGAGTLRGALVMPLMKTGLLKGTIKFNLITAVKPAK